MHPPPYASSASTHNHNNEFILEFILCETKMADFERRQLYDSLPTLLISTEESCF